MSETIQPSPGGTDEVQQFGYAQKLKRSISSFESFALAFSVVSIITGITTTYGFTLATSGPRGIWMWLLAGVGQFLVVLVFAQLSTHIPLSGSSYQWGSRLANPKIGWGFGWLSFSFFTVAVASVSYSFTTQALSPLFGLELSNSGITAVCIGMIAIWVVVCIASTQLVAGINVAAVTAEIIGVIGITVALLAAVVVFGGDGSVSNLFSKGEIPSAGYYDYNGPFMLSILLAAFTLTGFEAAANVSEETEQAERNVPWALVRAVGISIVLGFLFLIALTIAIPDVASMSESAAPVAAILHDQFGSTVEKIFLVLVCVAIFAVGMLCMISSSRILYAMSRDRRFPGYQLFSRVSSRTQTPVPATLAIFVCAAGLMLIVGSSPETLANLFTATAILPALIYASVMVLFLLTKSKLPGRSPHFDLGRWATPVAAVALLWLLFELSALLLPSVFWTSVKIVGIFLAVGAVIFAGNWLFNRESLESEPGAVALEPEVPTEKVGA
jgi:amino acid transporter